MESPILANLTEYLHDPDSSARPSNPATVVAQGERAQRWLLDVYLFSWLELLAQLPAAGYRRARPRLRFERLRNEAATLKDARDADEWIFYLTSLQSLLRRLASEVNVPDERSMQWGIWARDIPMAVADGFEEITLDGSISDGIAAACMYAAFLAGMVIEDSGTAEEVSFAMFEQLPRQLLQIVKEVPLAPEA